MRIRAITRGLVRWLLTLVTIAAIVLLLYSTRHAAMWHSDDLRVGAGLAQGALYVSWRPHAWDPNAEGYPPTPGWTVARYGSAPPLVWWVELPRGASWHGVSIPLWMLIALAAIAAAVAWHRDRAAVRERVRALWVWLTPTREKRLSLRLVAACFVVHVLALVLVIMAFEALYAFFTDARANDPLRAVAWRMFVALFALSPAFPLLWAWIYVRSLNALFRRLRAGHCGACGYDLTGNLSGRCPECGTATAAQIAP